MRTYLIGVLAASVMVAGSFPALAVNEIDQEQAENKQAMGSVSVASVRGTMDDAIQQLQEKAQERGASHFRIVHMGTPGNSSLWSGSAIIY